MIKRRKGTRDERQIEIWNKNRERIKDLFERGGSFNITEAASQLKLTRTTVRNHFRTLQEEAFIRKEAGRYVYEPRVNFVLSPFDRKVVQAISEGGFGRVSRGDLGGIYLVTNPSLRSDYSWGIVSPLETEFFYRDPFWLREIFRYALREKMIEKKYFSAEKEIDKLSGGELNRLWRKLFGDTKLYAVVFSINPKKLLEWLKTDKGKMDLKKALPVKVRTRLYDEALKLWHDREVFAKRLKNLR